MPKLVQFKVTKCDLKQSDQIQQKILVSRGLRVMLDSDLAKLYGVTTKQLNQQLNRNIRSSFPASLHRDSRSHGDSWGSAAHDRLC